MNKERYESLLALHKEGRVDEAVRKTWSKSAQTAYSLYHYHRSAGISYIIALERELGSENPDPDKVAKYQTDASKFLDLADKYTKLAENA